jgi:hypothetical protein
MLPVVRLALSCIHDEIEVDASAVRDQVECFPVALGEMECTAESDVNVRLIDWVAVRLALSFDHETIESDAAALRDHDSSRDALDEKERTTRGKGVTNGSLDWLLVRELSMAVALAVKLGLYSVVKLIVCDNVLVRSIVLLTVLDMVPLCVP